jgi:transposase InsO family protein
MQQDKAHELAMFRFGLIAPVINGTFTEATKTAYYRKVASEALTLPDGRKASFAPSTLAGWEKLYRTEGFDALISHQRSDRGYSRKLGHDAQDAIIALRKEFPKINATMVYERLIETGVINKKDVSLSTIQRFIRFKVGKPDGSGQAKDRKAFEAERVCGIWQADTLYGPYVKDASGKSARAYLISIIDDKSRLIVGSRFFFADSAINFQKVFKDAVLRFGIPEKLFVDNGGPYKNSQLSGISGRLGTVLIHAQPGDGAAKGKIERVNRSIRTRMLSVLTPEQTSSLDTLNDALVTWVMKYNTTIHSSIGSTPMDAYRAGQSAVRIPVDAEWVQACFLNQVSRKVKNDATISIDNVSYDVPMIFIGTSVDVFYSPDDMASAHIRFEEDIYPIRPTDKVANSKTRRSTSPYTLDYSLKGDDDDIYTALPVKP